MPPAQPRIALPHQAPLPLHLVEFGGLLHVCLFGLELLIELLFQLQVLVLSV